MKSKFDAKQREKELADDHWVLPSFQAGSKQFKKPLVIIEDTLPVYFYQPQQQELNEEMMDEEDAGEERVSALLYSGRCKFGPEEMLSAAQPKSQPQQQGTTKQQVKPVVTSANNTLPTGKFARPEPVNNKKRKPDFKLPFERDAKRTKL